MYLVIPLDSPNANVSTPIGANLIPDEIDFIEAITGYQNLTHAWNRFGLNVEVVERVVKTLHE